MSGFHPFAGKAFFSLFSRREQEKGCNDPLKASIVKSKNQMTAIIILNWNGAKDTMQCLASLFRARQSGQCPFLWMVVDNGSSDNSVEKIKSWLGKQGEAFVELQEGESLVSEPRPTCGILYRLSENYGFAKGNNLGIELLERYFAGSNPEAAADVLAEGSAAKPADASRMRSPAYYLLLNNDTEVEPDFLFRLEEFAASHPEYAALTPQIRYGKPSRQIWNCGGRVRWGFRKYHYLKQDYSRIKEKDFISINLITGCALFFKRELLGNPDAWMGRPMPEGRFPHVFTERFFFGEEDFDFSLRMQAEGRKMACVLSSVIFHNQGATQGGLKRLGRARIFYLCRFIDVRQHWGMGLKYVLWKFLYLPYVAVVLHRIGASWGTACSLARNIGKEAGRMEGVSKEIFLEYIR